MTAAIAPLQTQLREADNGRAGNVLAGVRQRMKEVGDDPFRTPPKDTLAWAMQQPRPVELVRSSRAAHAVVLVDGDVGRALKQLARQVNVLRPVLKRLAVPGPAARSRYKAQKAAARRAQAARRQRRRDNPDWKPLRGQRREEVL
jgi:hypothetical protein